MQPTADNFAARLEYAAALVDQRLSKAMGAEAGPRDARLPDAIRHALFSGGKRFRPFLVLESAALFGIPAADAIDAAAAVECIHCYSLVHDDLPAMDNDELRRGEPTVWKAFGEWTAILAGDALQAMAFELLSAPAGSQDARIRLELVNVLALASGSRGMVGGQALDLEAAMSDRPAELAHIAKLQKMKTGALIEVACTAGAILADASPADRAALKTYGENIGFAFQISDDLLDAEGSSAEVGKATGKDAAAGKATLIGLLGTDPARRHRDDAIERAIQALSPFGERARTLVDAAKFMGQRSR